MKIIKTIVGIFAFLAISTIATAQVTETTTVSGTVVTPITTTVSPLDLGEMIQEVTTTVATNDAGAAEFIISGEAGKEVTLDFTFDASITDGTNTIPVTYTGEEGTTAGSATGTGNHDTSTQLTTFIDGTSSELYFWVGAAVTPAVDQVAGTYSGNLQVDISYTGN